MFCAALIPYRQQHFDGRSSVQGALQIAINKDIDPDSGIIWDTLFGIAPLYVAASHYFEGVWQENVWEGDRLKNPERVKNR